MTKPYSPEPEPEQAMRAPETWKPEPWSKRGEIEREIARREIERIKQTYFGGRA